MWGILGGRLTTKLVTRAMLLAGLLAALTATAAFAEEPVLFVRCWVAMQEKVKANRVRIRLS